LASRQGGGGTNELREGDDHSAPLPNEGGTIEDGKRDCSLAEFAGVLPSIGDQLLDPGVLSGLARDELRNRRLLTVVGRVFNPHDNQDCVALIVEERVPAEGERALVG
jgi:hypothetical protein